MMHVMSKHITNRQRPTSTRTRSARFIAARLRLDTNPRARMIENFLTGRGLRPAPLMTAAPASIRADALGTAVGDRCLAIRGG